MNKLRELGLAALCLLLAACGGGSSGNNASTDSTHPAVTALGADLVPAFVVPDLEAELIPPLDTSTALGSDLQPPTL